MADTAPAPPLLDEVVAAVAILRDPAGPGEPWIAAEIAAVLPLLAEGPSGLATDAWGATRLGATG